MKRITYQLMTEVNHGTEEHPNMVQTFTSAVIECGEAVFEANFSIAQKEAYNGEVTVEDIEDPETEPTTEERVDELETINAELEDALCDMDVVNQAQIVEIAELQAANAAIEDALCEIDMG